MGVEMYLGQSDQQASSASIVLSNRINAYQSLQISLQTFIGSYSLQGQTYTTAKTYSSQVLIPLLKGTILLDEAIKESCAKLPREYRSQVDQIDLMEDELRDKIQRAGLMASRHEYLASLERNKKIPNYSRAYDLSRTAGRYMEVEQRLQEKLQKLLTFNSQSAQLFSSIEPLLAAVQQGLKQVKNSWNAGSKAFTIPSSEDLAWTKPLNEQWEKREDEKVDAILANLYHNGEISLEIYQHVKSGKIKNMGGLLDVLFNSEYVQNLSEEARDQLIEKVLLKLAQAAPTIGNQAAKSISRGGLISALNVMLSSAPDNLKNIAYNVIEKVSGSSAMSSMKLGNLFGKLGTPTSGIVSKLGFDTPASAGLGILASGVDAWDQVGNGENVVNATAKGTAHTLMATAIITKSTAIGATVGSAIPLPVVGTMIGAVAGFATGVLISMGADVVFDSVYDNTVGKVVDWSMDNPVGQAINNTATDFVNSTNKVIGNAANSTFSSVKNTFEGVGDAVSGWFNSLGSVFG